MIGGGLGPYAPGEWSDDTQMAVVIAQVAAERGPRGVGPAGGLVIQCPRTPRTMVETPDWSAARERFVAETISLARARNRKIKIRDDPEERHRWWQRR